MLRRSLALAVRPLGRRTLAAHAAAAPKPAAPPAAAGKGSFLDKFPKHPDYEGLEGVVRYRFPHNYQVRGPAARARPPRPERTRLLTQLPSGPGGRAAAAARRRAAADHGERARRRGRAAGEDASAAPRRPNGGGTSSAPGARGTGERRMCVRGCADKPRGARCGGGARVWATASSSSARARPCRPPRTP